MAVLVRSRESREIYINIGPYVFSNEPFRGQRSSRLCDTQCNTLCQEVMCPLYMAGMSCC